MVCTAKEERRALLQCSLQLWPLSCPCQPNHRLSHSLASGKCFCERLDCAHSHVSHKSPYYQQMPFTVDMRQHTYHLGLAIVLQCFRTSFFETPIGMLWHCRNWLVFHWSWNKIVLNESIKKDFQDILVKYNDCLFARLPEQALMYRFELIWVF